MSEVVLLDDELKDAKNIGDVVCALGVFDGVHLGHQKLIADCKEFASSLGVSSAILTFDKDPEEIFNPTSVRQLLSNEDRFSALQSLGADYVLVKKFTKEFSQISPNDFIKQTLFKHMRPVGIFVGDNFRFGHKAQGDVALIKSALGQNAQNVFGEDLLCIDGEPVSSTRIRNLIEEGSLEKANKLLGHMFFIRAVVERGRQVGRTLGYPTANLRTLFPYVQLCSGVYVGYVLAKGSWHKASISVGVPKTFGNNLLPTIEAHLLDFDADIYDEVVEACFAKYLCPMQKFESSAELAHAIEGYTRTAHNLPEYDNFIDVA